MDTFKDKMRFDEMNAEAGAVGVWRRAGRPGQDPSDATRW
jgi:hypothetical protein